MRFSLVFSSVSILVLPLLSTACGSNSTGNSNNRSGLGGAAGSPFGDSGNVTSSGGFVTGSGGFVTASGGGTGAGAGTTSDGGDPGAGGFAGVGGTASTGGNTGIAGSTSTGGSTSAVSCSGKPGALRGKTDHAGFSAGGANRHFILYEPASLDANTAAPIVIVSHGDTMSAQNMFDITRYSAKADAEKFVVAFPTGETGDNGPLAPGPWNVGQNVCGAGAFVENTGNDQAFLEAIISFIEADQCVDHQHVFLTGFSMGGYLSNETGCINKDFRAVGPHSGGSHDLSACTGNAHEPVIIFHGTGDPLISVTCGTGARDAWVKRNGCGSQTTSVVVTGGHCEISQGCPADGQVELCLFDNMGHAWAGGTAGQAFADSTRASATDLGWEFFKRYAW